MHCNLNAFSMHFDDLLMYLRLGCVLYGSNRVQQDTVVCMYYGYSKALLDTFRFSIDALRMHL